MAFSPAKVVSILLAEFGTPEDSSAATREERKVAARFAAILREAVGAAVVVETDEEYLESDISVDFDWDHCDEHGDDSSGKTNDIDIGNIRVTSDQVCPVY
uniref:DDE_Tnp_1_7 domain-containing protein n=1 Tax=Haemonchus contortus TaxID=6289 RepID=A0A7I5E5H8_HAECO